MSRFAARLPFSPYGPFVVAKAFIYEGTPYQSGQEFPGEGLSLSDISPRLLRNLYEQRRLDNVPPKPPEEAVEPAIEGDGPKAEKSDAGAAGAGGEGDAPAEATDAATEADEATGEADVAAGDATEAEPATPEENPAYYMRRVGVGGFKIFKADGTPIGKSSKDEAVIKAELARLLAGG